MIQVAEPPSRNKVKSFRRNVLFWQGENNRVKKIFVVIKYLIISMNISKWCEKNKHGLLEQRYFLNS